MDETRGDPPPASFSGSPMRTSNSETPERDHITQEDLIAVVGEKEARKLRARQQKDRGVWFGLGMFGMIGWSVAIPTLLCVTLGIWLDTRWPSRFSWTLMLLLLGIVLGCLNAWFWVTRERRDITGGNTNAH